MSAEEKRALIQRLFKDVLNRGDMDLIDEIISPEYVEHAALPGQDGGGPAGLSSAWRPFVRRSRTWYGPSKTW